MTRPRDGELEPIPKIAAPLVAAVPRLALTIGEAAASIGCSRDFFDQHVRPDLRLIRRGRKVLVSVRELERWLADNSARTL
jgi:hypothetical protein